MKHLYRLSVALLLLIPITIRAQKNEKTFSLSGVIENNLNQPLPGATVYIPDLRTGTITDSAGNYRISGIPQGKFYIEINYSGYKTALKQILFNQDKVADFNLQISITEEKEIVITGASRATTLRRLPIPVAVISQKEFAQNLSTNIVNALSAIPGVNAVSTGPNVSKPFIRGLGYNRVLTLFDGIRQEDQQWGDEHGTEIDENIINQVEVIKGPASLMYGSDAIAGVINYIPQTTPPKGTRTGSAGLNYETNNNLIEGTANLQSYLGKWTYGITGSYKMAADYRNKIDGRVYNTAFRQSSLFAQTALHKSWGYSRFGLSYFNDLQEIPDGKRDSATRKFLMPLNDSIFTIAPPSVLRSYSISAEHQQVQHLMLYNISNFSLGKGRMTTQLGYQKSIRKEFEQENSNEPGLFLNLNTITYDVKYLFPDMGDFSLTAGLNGSHQSNIVDKGFESLIPAYKQWEAGPFLFGKWDHKNLILAGGIRWDMRYINTDPLYVSENDGIMKPVYGTDTAGASLLFPHYRHTFTGVSGSFGFTYQFSDHLSGKANIARGFRAPNIAEISSNGIHSGTQIYQLGQTDFKPEMNIQEDIGLTYDAQHLTFSASLFYNRIQNFIFNRKLVTATGQDSVIVPGFQTFQFAASRASLWGGEFSADIHPHPWDWLHFENSLSFVFARNLGIKGEQIPPEEKYLPLIPPLHLTSELRANIKKYGTFKDIFINFQMNAFNKQNRIFSENETETPTPGYVIFNAGIGASVTNRMKKTMFTFSVLSANLFNTAYQSNMSRLKYFEDFPNDPRGHYGIYNMGRNVSLRVTVPFHF